MRVNKLKNQLVHIKIPSAQKQNSEILIFKKQCVIIYHSEIINVSSSSLISETVHLCFLSSCLQCNKDTVKTDGESRGGICSQISAHMNATGEVRLERVLSSGCETIQACDFRCLETEPELQDVLFWGQWVLVQKGWGKCKWVKEQGRSIEAGVERTIERQYPDKQSPGTEKVSQSAMFQQL